MEKPRLPASAWRSDGGGGSSRPPVALSAEEEEVVDGDHRRHEGEVLLHERDTALHRLTGRSRGETLAGAEHLAGGRPVESTEDAHERGLAGAVLAEDGQHFAGADVEVDVAQRLHVTEAARDPHDPQRGIELVQA